MTKETRRRIQYTLLALFVLAGIRIALIFHSRNSGLEEPKPQSTAPLQADYYVTPRKLRDYDAASLKKDLAGKPVWTREGYRFSYYPYAGGHVDFKREAGTLGPIEQITVSDAITRPGPNGQQQIMLVFAKDGHDYAVPVGARQGETERIYSDEIFFYDDPHQLYKHWPADVWDSIAKHEVKPGMNELQASFAVGMGAPVAGDARVVHYPNGGHPLSVTYQDGRATQITQGS